MSDIFISYARKDQSTARLLADALEAIGCSVWWDPKIQSGKAFDRVIETAITEAKCVIVLWSKHSVESDWVRAEASNGLSRGILISIAIAEGLQLPLRFSQVHTEDFSGWDGATDAPEFTKLASDISAVVGGFRAEQQINSSDAIYKKKTPAYSVLLSVAGLILSIVFLYLYRKSGGEENTAGATRQTLYLILFCVSVSALLYGGFVIYFHAKGRRVTTPYKLGSLAAGILLTIACGFFLPRSPNETDLIIRVLDKQRKPVTAGTVKLDLVPVQEEPINSTGEVKFNNVPLNQLTNKIRLAVSSPGYNEHKFDMVYSDKRPLEVVLTEPSAIKIAGRIEDAGEMPIRNVEISVENTRYYTHSLTDGTFTLNVKAYADGDEIILRTSHPGYDDKLVTLAIKSPVTQAPDIVLKPIN